MNIAAEQPNVRLDGRYSIKETCQLVGIHRHTLRNYTEAGMIRSRMRKNGKRYFYLGSEIIKLWRSLT